jgi:hypothetical protein
MATSMENSGVVLPKFGKELFLNLDILRLCRRKEIKENKK